jgi:hypothetical protein
MLGSRRPGVPASRRPGVPVPTPRVLASRRPASWRPASWRPGSWGPGVLACWPGCAVRGRRPECRDHGRADDHGGSRGRARARDAGITDQFMIMERRAGDCLAAPPAAAARPGNPAVACTAATVPRLPTAQARRCRQRVTPPVSQGRPCGRGSRCRGYSIGGPLWWQPGRGLRRRWLVVAVLAAITRHRGGTWPLRARHRWPMAAVVRAWLTSTMVSCCFLACPGSRTGASWGYLAARGTAVTGQRRPRADTARADTARADTARADTARADTARADTGQAARPARAARAGAANPRRQPARAPARRTRPRTWTWILTPLAPAPRLGKSGFAKPSKQAARTARVIFPDHGRTDRQGYMDA